MEKGTWEVSKGTVVVTLALAAGLATACTTQAVGDGQTGQSQKGLLDGLGGGTNPTGTAKDGTSSTGGSTTPGTTPTAPSSGKSCYTSGSTTCDSCVNAKCCTVIDACVNNTACASIVQCLRANLCDDTACENYCLQQFPAGASTYRTGAQCIATSCGGSCSG